MAFLRSLFHKVLCCAIQETTSWDLLSEEAFARTRALVMGYIILGMLLFGMGINLVQGVGGIMPFLVGLFVAQILGIVWIFAGGSGLYAMLVYSFFLMLLGVYLLVVNPVGQEASLFWFLLFPPMLILCAGLRIGGMIFFIYYVFLIAMMLSPLDRYLHTSYSMAVRGRFLLTMLGSCIFSMLSEYARMRTHAALMEAIVRLNAEARNDALTGLGNRRGFMDFYHWFSRQSCRSCDPCALLMIDLDFFKKINDSYGHLVGDAVLVHVANLLQVSLRETDRIFRWGGEEFLVVLPAISHEDALLLAEHLRVIIQQSPCIVEKISVSLTACIGLYCGLAEKNPDICVAIADSNLYAAKQQGRNRVVG